MGWIEASWMHSHSKPIRVEHDFFHEKGFYVTFNGPTFAVQADELRDEFKQSSEVLLQSPFLEMIAVKLQPGYRNHEVPSGPLRQGKGFTVQGVKMERVPLGFDMATCLLFETSDLHYVMVSNREVVQFSTTERILKCMYRDDTVGLVCKFEGASQIFLPLLYMYFSKEAWNHATTSLQELLKKHPDSIKPLADCKIIASNDELSGIVNHGHPINNVLREFLDDKKDTRILTNGRPLVKGKKTYFTNDHGRKRFKVVVHGTKLEVFESNPENSFTVPVWSVKGFHRIYIPSVPRKQMGNSILVRLLDYKYKKYLYIGESVYSFETDESIHSYRSPIDEHGVSHPVALGFKTAYILSEKKSIPKTELPRNSDEIDWYEAYQKNKKHASDLKNVSNSP